MGRQFETRIDIVNISRTQGTLIKIENMFPEFEISSISKNCAIKDDSLEIEVKDIKPFEVFTIKVRLTPKRSGVFNLNPIISYYR